MDYELGVALIIDNYTLVISGGEFDGIRKGDTVKILDEKGIDITNPYTGTYLGQFPLEKDRVIVERVYDEFSICTTFTEKSLSVTDTMKEVNKNISDMYKTKEIKKRLNVEKLQPINVKSNTPIKIGDPVVIEK